MQRRALKLRVPCTMVGCGGGEEEEGLEMMLVSECGGNDGSGGGEKLSRGESSSFIYPEISSSSPSSPSPFSLPCSFLPPSHDRGYSHNFTAECKHSKPAETPIVARPVEEGN